MKLAPRNATEKIVAFAAVVVGLAVIALHNPLSGYTTTRPYEGLMAIFTCEEGWEKEVDGVTYFCRDGDAVARLFITDWYTGNPALPWLATLGSVFMLLAVAFAAYWVWLKMSRDKPADENRRPPV